VKKNTIATFVSTLVLTFIIAPAIAAQAATIPFLSSIFDTIQSYLPIVNSILAGVKPTTAQLTNSRDAVADKSVYGVSDETIDLTGEAYDPFDADGIINFDETASDAEDLKLATNQKTIGNRTIDEFQNASELRDMQGATQQVAASAKKLEEENKKMVATANNTITSAKNIVSSQPIGTCDSSLCAANAQNVLIAQQIDLQSAAISLAITNNAYNKISNNQQAILVKNEQENKEQEAAKARVKSISNSDGLINYIKAKKLMDTLF
jgi:hypothetical protein